jgi:hypothetical protein
MDDTVAMQDTNGPTPQAHVSKAETNSVSNEFSSMEQQHEGGPPGISLDIRPPGCSPLAPQSPSTASQQVRPADWVITGPVCRPHTLAAVDVCGLPDLLHVPYLGLFVCLRRFSLIPVVWLAMAAKTRPAAQAVAHGSMVRPAAHTAASTLMLPSKQPCLPLLAWT